MQNIPVLSTIAFGFIVIFSCAVYTLSQMPGKAYASPAEAAPPPRHTSMDFTYVDGPQSEPPAWPAVLTP